MASTREAGRSALIAIIAEWIVAEYVAEQEMLERVQPGDKSIEPDQASDAPCVAPIDVSFTCNDDGHA